MRGVTAIIDCQALRHNIRQIKKMVPGSKVLAVIKANAYGHGLVEVARTLMDADYYGVARIEEALELCNRGVTKRILLLEGFFVVQDLSLLSNSHIEIVVHCEEQLRALERYPIKNAFKVWMKFDSGMHRLGVRPEQAENFYRRIIRCSSVQKPVHLLTHLSHSYDLLDKTTQEQLDCFNQFAANKIGLKSIASSASILLWPSTHLDVVRPGILIYGVSPLIQYYASYYQLRPVMALKSILIAVRKHKAGESVGYGGLWVSQRDTYIGVVAIGYGDGYPRSAPSGTPVLLNGREVPIVGCISMDMMSVDLGSQPTDKVGDEVILWNKDLPVERLSTYVGVSPYELITKLTSRVIMKYIDDCE